MLHPIASGNMSLLMSEDTGRISSFWLLVALVLGILIVGDLTRRMTDARRMERGAQALATQVTALESSNVELEGKIATAGDDASVEAWARSQAKLIRDGERLVVPIPAEERSGVCGAPPHPPVDNAAMWEVSLALLGGG